jgi:2-polyprenyl-6-methoxyphenol hydroxylase-like FAD-dependent oxidoreductase
VNGEAESADVVIVGGGPVGLILAIELRLGGVQPVVLERLPEISQIPKGNGLIGQIVPTLAYRGLLKRLSAGATYAGPTPQFSFGPLRVELARLGASPLHILAIPQRRLEQRLGDRLHELGGSLRRGHEMTSLAPDDEGVTLSVTGPDGQYQIRAAWLVGCDGAHSIVRKQAGIGFPGYTSAEVSRIGRVTLPTAVLHARSNEVEIPGAGRLRLGEHASTPTGGYSIGWLRSLDADALPGAYIVSTREDGTREDGTREQATGDQAAGGPATREEPSAEPGTGDPEAPMTLAELSASVRRVIGAEIPMTEPTWLSRVAGNSRQADRYQSGRVLLAGDAAHVFGIGGSLNAGLLDAINLGWKLAATVAGGAPAGVLASYHTERHAAGARALLNSRAQRALGADGEPAAALRELMGELLRYPDSLRHVGELMEGSDVRYEMPGADGRPHPLVGHLAPDLRLRVQASGHGSAWYRFGGGKQRTSVAELMCAAGWVLLDFTPDGRVAARAEGWSGHVSSLVANQIPEPPIADALLIRPDGYVAWASGPGAKDPAAGVEAALRAWLG